MEPTKEQLEELKQIELEILRQFLDVCSRLNLRYYLIGGTLLGAVRHQGFIPWDDDIDVAMPRADYEVFLKEAPSLLPENLFVQTIWSDKEYFHVFGKLRNSDTTFIEKNAATRNMNHGVFIDIFPLDYYPEDKRSQKRMRAKIRIPSHRIVQCYNIQHSRSIQSRLLDYVGRLIYPSATKALIKRETVYRSIPQSGWLANYGGAWGKKEIVPVDWYGEGTELVFEGLKVMAPVHYDKWLTQVYGDYMQLPPEEKRVGHHYVDVIDLHRPYTEYVRR